MTTTFAGAALAFMPAVTIAVYYVWSLELTESYETVTVFIWSTFTEFLMLVPFNVWEISRASFTVELEAIVAAIYLEILVTAMAPADGSLK